ncbi:hypothetical protein SPBR_03122 [Sporothrix brasiliensis 5110]|uniref:AB hydrolase-1 domain-containing protein n=1 Tax=Sporothrix brasiliensis 5110 TaxID=1398154 RepID=A0A0C2IUI9_9PEZI|nr:uncharacterized protein SPBR_03122 [Sporothrix brasiliensis 5110]KIH92816.1 hypothetical protein SPBR_03122 [Sporothrix brasiliensis 5110]
MSLQFIENDGGKLAVETRGPANAPLVVCSPGLGDTRDAYYNVADQLVAAGYRVALVDLRGQGDASTGFGSYGDSETASDLIKVVETLAPGGGRAVLAGASMSGGAATIAAGQRPDLVAGVVLLGAFLRNGSAGAVLRFIMYLLFLRPWGPSMWKMYAATLWPGLGPDGAKARAARSTRLLTRKADAASSGSTESRWAAFQSLMGTIDHDKDVAPWLPKVKTQPALVVVGDKDPDWSQPVEEAAWVASQFAAGATTTLVVEGVGHAPQYEKPDVVGPEMVRFLNGLRQGDSFKTSA